MNSVAVSNSQTKGTNNLVNGTFGGLLTLVGGSALGVGVIVSSPISSMTDGYNSSGALGALLGLTVGSAVGAVEGGLVVVNSSVSCALQITTGVLRTPTWLLGVASGKDWDQSSERWIHYDLLEDIRTTFGVSEEHSRKAIDGEEEIPHIDANGLTDKGIVVKDTELYDLLGVAANCSTGEIRRAYYSKARECHPDRNLDDPLANERFQQLGAAYLILRQDKSRQLYNNYGKQAVANIEQQQLQQLSHPVTIFSMVFGCELFEPIFGEIQLAPMLKLFESKTNMSLNINFNTSNNNSSYSEEELSANGIALCQRKREVRCGVNLLRKMKPYLEGNAIDFKATIAAEIGELSQVPMGRALMLIIGRVFVDRVNSEKSTLQSITATVLGSGESLLSLYQYLQQSAVITSIAVMNRRAVNQMLASNSKKYNKTANATAASKTSNSTTTTSTSNNSTNTNSSKTSPRSTNTNTNTTTTNETNNNDTNSNETSKDSSPRSPRIPRRDSIESTVSVTASATTSSTSPTSPTSPLSTSTMTPTTSSHPTESSKSSETATPTTNISSPTSSSSNNSNNNNDNDKSDSSAPEATTPSNGDTSTTSTSASTPRTPPATSSTSSSAHKQGKRGSFVHPEDANRKATQADLKSLFSHIASLLWLVTKLDVAQTVDNMCVRVLHDSSATREELNARSEALMIMGELYINAGGLPGAGLEELVNRMCAQSGAFNSL